MYRLIRTIAQQAQQTAVKRGQNVSGPRCMSAAAQEQREYWRAVDEGERTDTSAVDEAAQLEDPEAFVEYYDAHLHNTDYDELADLLIVAATWYQTVKEAEGENYFKADRNSDVMFSMGIIAFVLNAITGATSAQTVINAETLRQVVNLKLRYNTLRA